MRVYFETQRWLIEALFGWRGEDAERAKFVEFYDEANTQIVEVDSIYLAADWQRAGIGTYLLQQIIAEADAAAMPVRLSTAKINPARSLYERLGFRVVEESEFKVYMERAGLDGLGRPSTGSDTVLACQAFRPRSASLGSLRG